MGICRDCGIIDQKMSTLGMMVNQYKLINITPTFPRYHKQPPVCNLLMCLHLLPNIFYTHFWTFCPCKIFKCDNLYKGVKCFIEKIIDFFGWATCAATARCTPSREIQIWEWAWKAWGGGKQMRSCQSSMKAGHSTALTLQRCTMQRCSWCSPWFWDSWSKPSLCNVEAKGTADRWRRTVSLLGVFTVTITSVAQ